MSDESTQEMPKRCGRRRGGASARMRAAIASDVLQLLEPIIECSARARASIGRVRDGYAAGASTWVENVTALHRSGHPVARPGKATGSSLPLGAELAESWIPATSAGMTVESVEIVGTPRAAHLAVECAGSAATRALPQRRLRGPADRGTASRRRSGPACRRRRGGGRYRRRRGAAAGAPDAARP